MLLIQNIIYNEIFRDAISLSGNYLAEAKIIVLMQISAEQFKLERAEITWWKLTKKWNAKYKSKIQIFFCCSAVPVQSRCFNASLVVACVFLRIFFSLSAIGLWWWIDFIVLTGRNRELAEERKKNSASNHFKFCWYDSVYLQAIPHMPLKASEIKKTNKIHSKLNPFMCWVECVPNQLRTQWFMAKVCTCVFRISHCLRQLNLVHRSTDSGFLSISPRMPFLFHLC